MKSLQFVLLSMLIWQGATAVTQGETVTLVLAVENASNAENVSLSLTGRTPDETLTPDDVVTAVVEVPKSAVTNGSLSVRWHGDSQARAPLAFTLTMGGIEVEAYLLDRQFTETPRQSEISAACLRSEPESIRDAFEMLFTCRAMALVLDETRQFDKPHRSALQGWLVANTFLFERFGWDVDVAGNPIGLSPYGADPQLVDNLNEVIEVGGDAERWRPLRIADAHRFIKLVESRPLRLAGDVPRLIRMGEYEVAQKINDDAIKVVREQAPQGGSVNGLTVNSLQEQGCLLSTLINNGNPVPACLD